MKITNDDLIKDLGLNKNTFYSMKRTEKGKRKIDLMKKGLWAERNVKAETLLNGIKQDNKRA